MSWFREAATKWSVDKGQRLGAALAFYSVLSIAPLLVIMMAAAGAIFGDKAASGEIESQIEGLIGREGALAIQDLIVHAQRPKEGIVATVLGTLTLLLGASGVFGEMQDSLNLIWRCRARPGRSLQAYLSDRLLSFVMVLGTAFLLIVSLVISALLAAAEKILGAMFSGFEVFSPALGMGTSFLVLTLLFALIFKFVPDVWISWREVWGGAAVTSLLFALGKHLFGLYLGRSGVASAYGAAGSLVVLIIWTYYSAQILYFGAELTWVTARRRGTRTVPARNAELIPPTISPMSPAV
ncbi:MAG: YihY/virulence factor BrkB family protein [Planctomycetia bacterium]|nr:YihY/virulence factor BrkB family protein [Planctomycetia bacterium]